MEIHHFTFNPFSENTYLIIGGNNECIVVDPGMSSTDEWDEFDRFLKSRSLAPTRLILTHAHIDHVLGCHGMHERYGLSVECHKESLPVWEANERVAEMYGVPYVAAPEPATFFSENDTIDFDGQSLEIRFVPGHAPGHVIFIDHQSKALIAGDTLFLRSIGRTDLPGGDHDLLLAKIVSEMYSLPEEYVVHPGHGPSTTIGEEKASNPFVRG